VENSIKLKFHTKQTMKKLILSTVILFAVLASSCTQRAENQIFNGRDLSNWGFVLEDTSLDPSQVFRVIDGGIISIRGDLGYMYTHETFTNYTLELEWRWPGEASNSGIFVLIEDTKNPFATCVEVQLWTGRAGDFVLLAGSDIAEFTVPPGEERPDFPIVEKRNPSNERPVGEWNHARIIVENGVITVYINGLLQNIGTSQVREGRIGLQSEGEEIQFRNIRLL
jgi:hypothetical protein